MSGASDIAKLFAVAGGSPAQYQEVERTEQQDGVRGRWSAHADADPDLAAQGDAAFDASQPLISWSIAAVTEEPPPVVAAAQKSPAIRAAVHPAAESPTQAAIEAPAEVPIRAPIQAPAEAPIQPAVQPATEPVIEPAVQAAPAPNAAAPQATALSSVFARLMERNEPRGKS